MKTKTTLISKIKKYSQFLNLPQDFLNECGFTFEELENSTTMCLRKVVGDKEVEVSFQSRQPTPEEEDQNQPEQGQGKQSTITIRKSR
jgi:hypothetical protein